VTIRRSAVALIINSGTALVRSFFGAPYAGVPQSRSALAGEFAV
jgi:hypothetical protein